MSPSRAVVEEVAEREGVEPTDLPPLYDVINPDSLNTIFTRDDEGRSDRVVFDYLEYEVMVHGSGRVEVRETER